jgi:hypothetical protein
LVLGLSISILICIATGLVELVNIEVLVVSHLFLGDFISIDTHAAGTLPVAHRYLSPEEIALTRNASIMFFDLL